MDEALAAALQLADAQGIRTSEEQARVLSARGNLLVHLQPAPVVARVATFTAMSRRDPFAWLAREVSVAGYAARHGGPVVPPTDLADPGPHRVNGFAISLWTYAERAETSQPLGQALGELHLSLAGYPDELPYFLAGTAQVTEAFDAVADHPAVPALRRRHAEAIAAFPRPDDDLIVLHGDAHRGNLIAGRWIDMEETSSGPRLWDLAVLSRSAADQPVLADYAKVTGVAVPDQEQLMVFWKIRDLEATAWTLCMAAQYPERYEPIARELLGKLR